MTIDKLLEFPLRTPDLYDAKVAPLVKKAMNGFNSTIFAYVEWSIGAYRQIWPDWKWKVLHNGALAR